MLTSHFVFGPIETNCYLVACEETGEAMIVDPDIRQPEEAERIVAQLKRGGSRLKYIVNTHHHMDHTGGNAMLKEMTSAEILIHELDASVLPEQWKWVREMMSIRKPPPCPVCGSEQAVFNIDEEHRSGCLNCPSCGFKFEILRSPPADRTLRHGDVIRVGNLEISVIHTPGHTRGGMCLYAEKQNVIFTGDTLFSLSVGRTDTIDGSLEDIIRSGKQLIVLPEDTIVYPGHGEKTTIGREKRENPFFQEKI